MSSYHRFSKKKKKGSSYFNLLGKKTSQCTNMASLNIFNKNKTHNTELAGARYLIKTGSQI